MRYPIRTPITRIGNKTSLLPIILSVFPREFGRYIEIFGGSGAVLLELDLLPLNSREEFSSWLHFHDGGSEPTIHLPDQVEIIDRTVPASLHTEAEKLKTALRKRSDYRDVRQAAAYLMRVRNSYSSSGRSFACQPFNVRTLFEQIREMSRRLETVIIEQQSFDQLIPHYDREESFFYADPPYYDSEYVYDAEFTWDHHVLLRDTLTKCKGKWLVSQADCPEIRYLLIRYNKLRKLKRA